MSKTVRARLLARAFEKEEDFAANGYGVSPGATPGDVIILRSGHVVGIWRCRSTNFEWIRAGRSAPCLITDEVQEAVAYTMGWIKKASK